MEYNLPGPSTSADPFVPPSQRDDAPLAGILPPELEDIDPKKFFPDFEQNGTLRFSRIFASNMKPTMRNQIWWTSRTFRRETAAKKATTKESEELAAISTIQKGKAEQKTGEEDEGKKPEEEGNGGEPIKKADEAEETAPRNPWSLRIGPPPKKDQCCTDEYELLCAENLEELLSQKQQEQTNEDDDEAAPPWRFGPAQMWYDRMGVPANPANFDYGLKKRGTAPKTSAEPVLSSMEEDDRTFLPVNLIHWEDDIIIDPEEAKQKLVKELSSVKVPRCGWIPTPHTRTYKAFMAAWKNRSFIDYLLNPSRPTPPANDIPDFADSRHFIDPQHSLFPFDNYELEHTRWEDDIIWDSANMPAIPKPRILTLDYEDDPRAFGMPDDGSGAAQAGEDMVQQQQQQKALGKEQCGMKKSKLILAQVLKRQRQEEEEQIETQIAQIADKDPFNLSNDEYYAPKTNSAKTQRSLTNITIQHSLPAQNIHPALFPFLQSIAQLRHFHRNALNKRAMHALIGRQTAIHSLTRHIRLKGKEHQHLADGGGLELFVMRELHNLTGRDGKLVLLEYSEEHPPLLNQTGMASKIRNYYKRKLPKEKEQAEFEFGETAFSHASPFLGTLSGAESLQAVENNMFRATIFKHTPPGTDFLLIRNKFGLFLRQFPALFVVGQQMPLYEVHGPNSKRAKDFNKEFIMSHIFRLLWQSDDIPRRIRMDDIRQMYPGQEGMIRKNLKQCAELRKFEGQEYWVLKEDFRLPNKEEVANMVTPEMYCAHASMMAAEQRLRDAGYGEKYLHVPENADDSDDQQNVEDEIKCAPWNTTRAYIAALKGKCFLDQSGIADPTGSSLGFSFVRVNSKPLKPPKEEVEKEKDGSKKLVTGTNADLRKLSLKEARQMCREFGLTEEEIHSLERWDVIDVIRTLSTQAAQGSSDSQVARFARGNARATFADMQNKHKEHCQRVFEQQNRWLGSAEQQASDDEWGESDDEGGEQFGGGGARGKHYSTTVTLNQAERRKLEFEREERERLDLQRMIRGEVTKGSSTVSAGAKEAVAATATKGPGGLMAREGPQDSFTVPNPQQSNGGQLLPKREQRKLKIYRTIRNSDGTESTRIETVTHPQLIEAYVRIRSTRDDNFIKVYAQMDEQYKEEKRKERRRQQENAKKMKTTKPEKDSGPKSIERAILSPEKKPAESPLPPPLPLQRLKPGPKPKKPPPEKKEKPPPPPPKQQKDLKITCSACGEIGHMKTNRNCPLYGKEEEDEDDLASKTVGQICQPTTSKLSDLPDAEGDRLPSGELIEVEGTRLKISKKLYQHAEKERKDALRLHIPRKILEGGTTGVKKGKGKKMIKRTPTITTEPMEPVDNMEQQSGASLSTMTAVAADETVMGTSSKMRAPLTLSISIASTGSATSTAHPAPGTGGPLSALSSASSSGPGIPPLSAGPFGRRRGTIEEADYLMGPLKSVHRRRADPRVSMASLLMDVLNELKNMEGSEHFAFPVNIKQVPDYLEVVKKPMDLQQIRKNISENKYELRRQFLEDMTQILINSLTYNGPAHPITEAARRMLHHATKRLEENEQKLIELEKQINPLLDDDDMVGFSHILLQIVQECKNLPKSAAFHTRVDTKKFPQYNEKIQRPMDLGTIEQNIKDHRYTTVSAFRRDIEQILINSQIFNGHQSAYTLKAAEIVELTDQLLGKSQGHLAELEANIQKALNANDDGAASSVAGDDRASLASWSAEIGTGEKAEVKEEEGEEMPEGREREEAEEGGGRITPTEKDGAAPPQDIPERGAAKFYVGGEDEEEEEEGGGVLQDDLALSGEESGEEEEEMAMDEEEEEAKGWDEGGVGVSEEQLLQSDMHTSGQLNADLALSDSDDDDQLMTAKRPRMEKDFDASL